MNQQPDKFFRDKLEGFQKNPPASAWDKIAAAQNKKKSKGLWWRIAATFLLLAAAAYLLLPANRIEPDATLAETGNAHNDLPDTTKKQPSIEDLTKKVEPAKETPDHIAHNNINKNSVNKKRTAKNKNETEAVSPSDEQADRNNGVPTVPEDKDSESKAVAVAEIGVNKNSNHPAEIKHVTLTYSAQDVSEYLNKTSLADATSEEKKPSTLKKLLKKANDLNTNQDPLGELRQRKNEILALNFRNDKQRGQNK